MAHNKDNFDRKPEYWESMHRKRRGMFSVVTLIGPLVVIAIVLLAYYYLIEVLNFFPDWKIYLYWFTKLTVAFEIFTMAARSLWGPILTVMVGIGLLFGERLYDFPLFNMSDAWQIIIVGIAGFLVTIMVKM